MDAEIHITMISGILLVIRLQQLDWTEQCFTSPPTEYRLRGAIKKFSA